MKIVLNSGGILQELSEADLDELLIGEACAHQYPWSRENFLSSLHSSHITWLVKKDGKIAASLVATKRGSEAEVLMITVYPSFQRQGLATQLMNYFEDYCKPSVEQIFLEVRASNTAATAFYESQEFLEVGVRPRYYPRAKGGREDAVIMAKPLF